MSATLQAGNMKGRELERESDAKDKEEKARGRLGHQQVYLSICLFANIS